jgi:hypothetical protein
MQVVRELSATTTEAVVQLLDEKEEAARLVVAAQACPQGRERQLIHFPLMHKKYTLKLTKMQSDSIQAPRRDEGVSSKVKNRSLTRSRGLL